jgi:acyl-CoA hydrolase
VRAVEAERAVKAIRNGDHVFVGSACATPRTLLRALEALSSPPAGVQLAHFLTDGAVVEVDGQARSSFRHRAFYLAREMLRLSASDSVAYVPMSLSEVPRLLASGRLAFDVALVQASPPNAAGMCSLGVSVDVTRAAVLSARMVIAEDNPSMPRTGPQDEVPFERFDQIVAIDAPVIEYLHEPLGATAERIARYVARIIEDGATLQIGLGRVPNQMLQFLGERSDLGIHSDVITEPVVDLIERGIVTGARKTFTAVRSSPAWRWDATPLRPDRRGPARRLLPDRVRLRPGDHRRQRRHGLGDAGVRHRRVWAGVCRHT